MNPARKYAQTQTTTASRERLMVMLFETALRQTRTGAQAAEAGSRVEAANALTKASDIVAELNGSLDHTQAPELCKQLSSLYLFVLSRLARASTQMDAIAAREAERALAPVVEAFAQAVDSLGDGHRSTP